MRVRALPAGVLSCFTFAWIVQGYCAPPAALAADSTTLTSQKKAFYVLVDRTYEPTIVAISVADEFNKFLTGNYKMTGDGNMAVNPPAWVIPEPSWGEADLINQCAADPSALGGVIITAYSGSATHFWILWQSQTTTFSLFARLISCNSKKPTIVGVIGHTVGAGKAPWVVRQSDASVPLITLAAIISLLTPKNGNGSSSGTNLTLGAVVGTLFTDTSKDIPGYSEPVRLRRASQHIGLDVLGATQWLCRTNSVGGGMRDAHPGSDLCQGLGFTAADETATP